MPAKAKQPIPYGLTGSQGRLRASQRALACAARELLTRVQAGEATPSELATAVSYLRATKRPEKQGEATSDDQIATAMADLQAGRERARQRREALERRQGDEA